MIWLSGDLHHAGLKTGNQRHADISEIQGAHRYLELLADVGVKVTFFVSGRAFDDEWSDLAPIVEHPLVEIGGHNYACFKPELPHRIYKKLTGNYHGPAWLERADVLRTLAAARRRTSKPVRCWRNHMYMHGPNTERVLAGCGIELCSDGVDRFASGPRWHPAGLYNLPINIIPDHEHLYHAERTREWVARWQARYAWSDDYGPASYDIDRWTELVLAGLAEREAARVLSTVIIHPITMYLCDRFASFRRILQFLAAARTVHASEVLALADARRAGRAVEVER